MPQLDKFAFAPQVFWLVVIFFSLYLFTLRDGLSLLYKISVFRKRFVNILSAEVSSLSIEVLFVQQSTSKFISSFLQTRNVVDSTFKSLEISLNRRRGSYEVLRSIRSNLVFHTVTPYFVGVKQSLIPTSQQYASLKFV